MSAYVISEVDVRDATGFEAYRTIAAQAIATRTVVQEID